MRGSLIALVFMLGCAPEAKVPDSPEEIESVQLSLQIEDDTVAAGGELVIRALGAGLVVADWARVDVAGTIGGMDSARSFELTPEVEGDTIVVRISATDLRALSPGNTEFDFRGAVRCTVGDFSKQVLAVGLARDQRLRVVTRLTPALTAPSQLSTHLSEAHTWPSEGVLRDGEGQSWLEIDGELVAESGRRAVVGRAPIEVGPAGRTEARVRWSAALAGIEPGRFEGRARIVNEHLKASALEGAWQALDAVIEPTSFWGFEPARISRGQKINAVGQGFIGSGDGSGAAMLFELSGQFQPADGPVETVVWLWSPEAVGSHDEAQLALRTETETQLGREVLTGMSARTGTFLGSVTPVLLDGRTEVRGEPWEGSLTLAPTHQVVYVRFLPSGSEALESFGLRNVEPEVRARTFELLEAHFEGVNISFVDEAPEGWQEYTTIEVGGADPNGAGLLGLDNTEGRDLGNLRLDDVIGGVNAQTRSEGYYAFGGVFVGSFAAFSPTLAKGQGLESPRFDAIFGPFMPALGGWPAEPGDGRGHEAQEAARAMGGLIAHTVSHELGHALGLALREDGTADPNHDHNLTDEPGSLMDSGHNRPFEERCGLPGSEETRFNAVHRRYLNAILPAP